MQLKSILALALAATVCTGAGAQKKLDKIKKKAGNTIALKAAELTPALKPVDGKTFSYAFGIAQGASLKQFLVSQKGVDTAYVHVALEAMSAKLSDAERKEKKAYAAGLEIGEINDRNLPLFNKEATGSEDSAYIDRSLFEKGLKDAALSRQTALTADSAMKIVEGQMKYQQGVYKNLNEQYLAQNAKQKGVKTLPSGLQYRILTEGNGPVATDSTEVDVHYEGKLIDGTVFDSSYKRGKAATFRPSQVIKGWKEALTMMPEGSKWTLYIPAALGYGERGQGQTIPGNSTLIFDVEIIKVKK